MTEVGGSVFESQSPNTPERAQTYQSAALALFFRYGMRFWVRVQQLGIWTLMVSFKFLTLTLRNRKGTLNECTATLSTVQGCTRHGLV